MTASNSFKKDKILRNLTFVIEYLGDKDLYTEIYKTLIKDI